MDAIEMLLNRTSCPQLAPPEPTREELDILYRAAFRAADHRQLKPFRFLEIRGEGRERLGALFLEAARARGEALTESEAARLQSLPLRAPLLLVAIAVHRPDPKVPEVEQLLAGGAALQNLLNAAFALGLGAIWRTGAPAHDPRVWRGLGLGEGERILGFVYLGRPAMERGAPPHRDHRPHVASWP
ncbi:MAG: nitroreductase [Porticoccaceae bacterium]|nr:MAG: nitroreductase [Porticoccaceae bacterium]